MNELHWYSFAYTSGKETGSTHTGYDTKGVTLEMIKDNKVNAGMTKRSVLLSVCYLGYMTTEEFTGEAK